MAKAKKVVIVNYEYDCLHSQTKGVLRSVSNGTRNSINQDLKQFARSIENFRDIIPVENGFLGVLSFEGNKGIPFVIIQKMRSDTFDKTSQMIGEEFDIIRVPKPEPKEKK